MSKDRSMRPRPINTLHPLPVIILEEGEQLEDRIKELNLDELVTPKKPRRREDEANMIEQGEELVKLGGASKEEEVERTKLYTEGEEVPEKGDIFVPEVREVPGYEFDQTPWQPPSEMITYDVPEDLWVSVDYDMEGGDKKAIDNINSELANAPDEEAIHSTKPPLTPSIFERLVDTFEKASFEFLYTDEGKSFAEATVHHDASSSSSSSSSAAILSTTSAATPSTQSSKTKERKKKEKSKKEAKPSRKRKRLVEDSSTAPSASVDEGGTAGTLPASATEKQQSPVPVKKEKRGRKKRRTERPEGGKTIMDMFIHQAKHSSNGQTKSTTVSPQRATTGHSHTPQQGTPEVDDELCCICGQGDSTDANVIIFCDGCNIAIHQSCYGVPAVPQGSWYCARCSPDAPPLDVRCVLCPLKDGAFKKTEEGEWAHVVCAMWTPETFFKDWHLMEPIGGVADVDKERFNLKCTFCGQANVGACIQCKDRHCFEAYHPSCAQKEGLLMEMREGKGDNLILHTYCKRHSQKIREEREKQQLLSPASLGVEDSPIALRIKEKAQDRTRADMRVIDAVYRYWIEKRRTRDPLFKTPLLRRLQVLAEDHEVAQMLAKKSQGKQLHAAESATGTKGTSKSVGVSGIESEEAELRAEPVTPRMMGAMKSWQSLSDGDAYLAMKKLRQELDIARILVDLCRKRELWKTNRLQVMNEIFETRLKEIMEGKDVSLSDEEGMEEPRVVRKKPRRSSKDGEQKKEKEKVKKEKVKKEKEKGKEKEKKEKRKKSKSADSDKENAKMRPRKDKGKKEKEKRKKTVKVPQEEDKENNHKERNEAKHQEPSDLKLTLRWNNETSHFMPQPAATKTPTEGHERRKKAFYQRRKKRLLPQTAPSTPLQKQEPQTPPPNTDIMKSEQNGTTPGHSKKGNYQQSSIFTFFSPKAKLGTGGEQKPTAAAALVGEASSSRKLF